MPTDTWHRLPAARRQAVLEAAEAEFAARGFSGGSLNAIARNAKVSKGSLFQYFTDKAELYAHLSDLASVRIRTAMVRRIEKMSWTEDFFGSLRAMLLVWTEYFDTHPIDRAFTAAVSLEPDPAARSAVRFVVNRHYIEVLRPLLQIARDAGQLDREADLDAFLALLLLLMPHLAIAPTSPGLDPVLGLTEADPATTAEAVDRLVGALRSGFAPRDADGSR
ncbi:TetR/AcrR family transcriptional regulator [Pseudonocardia sp. H11422]|uniref:TetR/AcrR family transcriptional regulator n=1 Tax=Pseudonocardia sp. H11422 TaxID=2835866 RepID=UPI001BDC2BCD|nr:TetR/AcrR family transcriptional regulator [Pseudonocardia sp. H11422]